MAGRRDVLHSVLPTPTLMLRLIGNSLDPSDFDRIDTWIDRINKAKNQLDEVYLFFHQPSMQDVPEMVNYFIERSVNMGLSHHYDRLEPKYLENTQLRLF